MTKSEDGGLGMRRKDFLKKLSFTLLLVILGMGIYYLYFVKETNEIPEKTEADYSGYEEERLALESFINRYFIEDGFFRTNLTDSPQGEIASGEDILSESLGLLMLYYLKIDQPEKFDVQVTILSEHFMNYNKLVKCRIRREIEKKTVNATIDDLRIAKALMMAADKWQRDEYKVIAEELSTHLLTHCIIEDQLRSYDSPESPKAPLVYYDLGAMQWLGQFNKEWYRLADINVDNILNSQVKGLPFYQDTRFLAENQFPAVENFMIMMHLSEIGIKDPQSLNWLKDQLRQQGLYGSYSIEGKPLNTIESPAIYAIVARIAQRNHDEELYYLVVNRLKSMQNLEDNEYYGGFIDLNQLSAFSFDQLFSLLAY